MSRFLEARSSSPTSVRARSASTRAQEKASSSPKLVRSTELDDERLEPTQRGVGPEARLFADQSDFWEPKEQGAQSSLRFHAGQRGADAVVGTLAEGEVTVRGSSEVEPVGLLETKGVAVGRAEHQVHDLAGDDAIAADFEILFRPPRRDLDWTVETQKLLDGARQKRRLGAQPRERGRIPQQRKRSVSDEVRRR